jgi:hypothetical protein
VGEVLATEAAAEGRVQTWVDALRAGRLGAPTDPGAYVPEDWTRALADEQATTSAIAQADAYRFFAAADYHRNYVLKRLLPSVGLFVA